MSYAISQLLGKDTNDLKALLKVFAVAFEDNETYQGAVPTDEYLAAFLAKPQNIVIIAKTGDQVVGGLVAYELEKFEQDRREIYIYDLAVAEEYRRQGVATALINELKMVAQERDAYIIFVQADQSDEHAIKLYESLGVKEQVFQFDIPVD